MARLTEHQLKRALLAADGYLALDMPQHALDALRPVHVPGELAFEFHRIRGEIYRSLQQWQLALDDFQQCHALQPADISVLMGLAWCYKRVDQLPKAIAAMHAAHRADGKEPIILYNLACYYSLAKNKSQALTWLGRALRMHRDLMQLIPKETDFDPLRDDPDFLKLLDLARGRDTPSAA